MIILFIILLSIVLIQHLFLCKRREAYTDRSACAKLDQSCTIKLPLDTECLNKSIVYGNFTSNKDGLYCPDGMYLKSIRFKKSNYEQDRISGIQAWCGEMNSCTSKEWRSAYSGDVSKWHKVTLGIPTLPLKIITDTSTGDLVFSPTNLMDTGVLDLQNCDVSQYNIRDVESRDGIKGILWSHNKNYITGIQFIYNSACDIDSRLKIDVV